MPTAYITHPACRLHEMMAGHPEAPARIGAIGDLLLAEGLLDHLLYHEAPAASLEQIKRAHDPAHVDWVVASSPAEGLFALDPDTQMGPATLTAALHAAGAVVHAVDLVMNGEASTAFCNVRPPGHHAERARAMGFCFFNNVAVGMMHALATHGLERVAVIDFDVHHGNGTEDIIRDEPRVLMCSTYQFPLYPFIRAARVEDHMVNVALPPGSDGGALRQAVEREWLPSLERFRPEMIFVSAGFDGHLEDPLADLRLVERDYAWVTTELLAVAERHAAGRVVSTLEGGYDLSALARSASAHVRALMRL